MNIFIIHSGENKEQVPDVIKAIKNNSKNANVLFLQYRKAWKPEVRRLMKLAQMVLYIVGGNSCESKNIDWELRGAIKQRKTIVCYKLEEGITRLNKVLYTKDTFTKQEVFLADEVNSLEDISRIVTDYESGSYISLINNDANEKELFEQYKIFAETSEALVDRRQGVNNFYISANAALITIAATAFSLNGDWISKLIITVFLSLPGILLNHSWSKILTAYGILNSSKMKILGMIEKKLSASFYEAEWQVMSCKYNKKAYVSFTDGESKIPKIFTGVFIIIDIFCVIALIFMLVIK